MRAVVPRRWDIFAAVVLRRDPVIAPPMNEIESRYKFIQKQIEDENSLLCDFELKTKKDEVLLAKRAQLEKEGKELSELDGELGITSNMLIDDWIKRTNQLKEKYFLDNSKNSEQNNEKSIWRELDRKLVLVVKQKFERKNYSSPWILPQYKHQEGESLRQTAERCLASLLSGNTLATVAGDAPFAVFTHKYPKPISKETGSDGAKIFFYNAAIVPNWNDSIVNTKEIADFKWLNSEEFWKTVPGKVYKKQAEIVFLE